MLRTILLLLCAFQTLLNASVLPKTSRLILQRKLNNSNRVGSPRDNKYVTKTETSNDDFDRNLSILESPGNKKCADLKESPNGVDANFSDLSNSGKTTGVELDSPLAFELKSDSTARGCGTPLHVLFDKFEFIPIPSEIPGQSLRTTDNYEKVVEEGEEEEEDSGYELEDESDNDSISYKDLAYEVEARRHDKLNLYYAIQENNAASAALNAVTEGLENMGTSEKESSPITVTVSLNQENSLLPEIRVSDRLPDVYVEDVNSDDSDYEEERVRRERNISSYSRKQASVASTTSDATESTESNAKENATTNANATDNTRAETNASTATAAPSVAVKLAPACAIENVDLMKYRSIDSVLKLNLRERISLTVSLREQMVKSDKFESKIKLADIPPGVFMYKISSLVRVHRKTLLTREEMENSNLLIGAISACNLDLNQWFDFIELLKRADREYASDEIMSKAIIPYIIKEHGKGDEAGQENFELYILTRLTISGYVLVLNDLLKHSVVGKSLRSHLNFNDIQTFLSTLIDNGNISDKEIQECMELLLKGYDFEEFKASAQGKELAERCETNRKGLI